MLKVENVRKIYRDGKKDLHVLRGINLEAEKGATLAIVGPSGAGKSTLLHIMGGLDRPNSGRILLDNEELYRLPDKKRAWIRNSKIGFVFQFYHLLPEFNALENVLLPALVNRRMTADNKRARDRAKDLLREFGLENRLTHRPGELSGGEQQRVAIARALINNPELLLCDEPTGNLDSKIGEEILGILFGLNKKKATTIVIVTHDREIAKRSDRIIEIRDGMLA